MSKFERYLTVWVALFIVAGIALGFVMPGLFHAIGSADIARVNLPVAALIWLMIVPMLLKIDFAALAWTRRLKNGDFPMTELALLGAAAVSAAIMVLVFNKRRFNASPVLVRNRKPQP
jgi:ACR3 family arsenite efflux pump ArsB